MLAVHGRRGDGFHELTSLAVPLRFGDDLTVSRIGSGADRLYCSDPEVPVGGGNLILRAARVFRGAVEWAGFFRFDLEKRIPVGGGLGGGSSNAAAALVAMNRIAGCPLNHERLRELAAGIGSDCPFFIDPVPAVMRGRGERIEPLGMERSGPLSGRRVWIFRPPFPVSTAWAYAELAAGAPDSYRGEDAAAAALNAFRASGDPKVLLENSFEPVVGAKFLALSTLLGQLRNDFGLPCLMSGSGSCCFALPEESGPAAGDVERRIRTCWGKGAFWVETSIV